MKSLDRKEFLTALSRVSLLTIVMVLIGWLISKDKLSLTSECSVNKYCKNCSKFGGCSLPEALKMKENEQG